MTLIEQILDPQVLRQHVNEKIIGEQKNRWWGNVCIYNYGRKVQYDPALWNNVTELCRGLIVNWDSGEVLARPFRKFFNLETNYRPETHMSAIPAGLPEVTKKLDGSLGILWRYDNDTFIATRGSFGSSQSRWATKFFKEHYRDVFPSGWTPLFEIIYPENRIVVKYDREEMVLLGMVNIATGEEMPHAELAQWDEKCGCPIVELFNGKEIETMRWENTPNEEGYVLTWHKPADSPLKLKVKFTEYQHIHRMVTGLSIKRIWELMREGITLEMEFGGDLPEHFTQWANVHVARIQGKYDSLLAAANEVWEKRPDTSDRKELALYFTQHEYPIPPVCFARLDGKDDTEAIWKSCRPKPEDAFATAVVEV